VFLLSRVCFVADTSPLVEFRAARELNLNSDLEGASDSRAGKTSYHPEGASATCGWHDGTGRL